jgi:hypothetical protein
MTAFCASGVKFFVTVRPGSRFVEEFLRKIYEFYADYVLKVAGCVLGERVCFGYCTPVRAVVCVAGWQNAFYETDMPIRCEKFDTAIESYVRAIHMSL